WPAPAVGVLVTALLATGCSSDVQTVAVSGSSTVEPISIAVAEQFSEDHPAVSISVDGPGTGDGFELFCDGLLDINDASSKIKPEQIGQCSDNGVDFIELQIANDGIAVLTSEQNDT